MFDPHKVVGFEWDEGNERKSFEKHSVSRADSEQIFFDLHLIILADTQHSARETRYHALGATTAGRLLHVTFTLRNDETLVRVISARAMSRKEHIQYDQDT